MKNKTIDYLWVLLTAASRFAPLSAIPILIRTNEPSEVDWFALIQTDASLLAVFFGFSQSAFIQKHYLEKSKSEIVFVTSIVPIFLGVLSLFIVFIFNGDRLFWLCTIGFALVTAYVPQYQALLKCTRGYRTAVYADSLRLALYFICIALSALTKVLTPILMLIILGAFYAIPYIALAGGRTKLGVLSPVRVLWVQSAKWLFELTAASLISVAAWMSIRYAINDFGKAGDLSIFSAVFSVSSVLALVVDMVFVRVGQDIVQAAIKRDRRELVVAFTKIVKYVGFSSFFVALFVFGYVALQFGYMKDVLFMTTGILGGYFVRAIYVFFQNILIGLGVSRFDFLGATLMLVIGASFSGIAINKLGLAGAGVIFFFLAFVNLSVLGTGVLLAWKRKC